MKFIKILLIILASMNSIYSQENDVKYLYLNEDSVIVENYSYIIESNTLKKNKFSSLSYSSDCKSFSLKERLVYLQPDIKPEFNGGETALYDFLNSFFSEFSQPNTIVDVAFIVNTDGIIEDVFIKKGYKDGNDLFAIDIIRKMPKWIPGRNREFEVNSLVSLKIEFVYKPLE
jgi:hypothetical protein